MDRISTEDRKITTMGIEVVTVGTEDTGIGEDTVADTAVGIEDAEIVDTEGIEDAADMDSKDTTPISLIFLYTASRDPFQEFCWNFDIK